MVDIILIKRKMYLAKIAEYKVDFDDIQLIVEYKNNNLTRISIIGGTVTDT